MAGDQELVPCVGVYLLEQREIKGEEQTEENNCPCLTHHPGAARRAAEPLGYKNVCCAETYGKLAGRSLSLGTGALKASEPWKLGLIIS